MNREKIGEIFEKKEVRRGLTILLLGSIVGYIMCSSISYTSKEYNKLKGQLNQIEKKNSELEDSISKKDGEINKLEVSKDKAKFFLELSDEEQKTIAETVQARQKVKEEKEAAEKEKNRIAKEKEEKKKAEEEAKAKEQEEIEKANSIDFNTIKFEMETILEGEFKDEVKDTRLDKIRINENIGTENIKKDVVVLIDLTWSVKNGENSTKTMLNMYGEHLSAKLAESLENGSEICIFYKSTYLNKKFKIASYVKDGKAYKQ